MKRLDESLDNLFEAFSEMVYPTKDQVKKALAAEKITTDGVALRIKEEEKYIEAIEKIRSHEFENKFSEILKDIVVE